VNKAIDIDVFSIFIFLGIFQGFFLSFFFITKNSPNIQANRYQGFLLLVLSLCINEQFLNMTGLITRVLPITNTSEPLNLVIGPLLYLYVIRSLDPRGTKWEWIHFIIAVLYFLYMCQDYIQSNDFKYNSYVNSYHPDWPLLKVNQTIPDDPFRIKQYLNVITAAQILFYIYLSLSVLLKKSRQRGEKLFRTDDDVLRSLRNMVLHIMALVIIFIIVKLNFKADLGDYFIGMYVAVFTLLTTFRVMNDSTYFDRTASFMDISIGKYRKSSLNEAGKQKILNNIITEFEKKQYFCENLASLSDLAKHIGESQHHVSQVINEKLGKNFFELLASYRIEKAKSILKGDKRGNLTIEELSEMVGYNSKTAFNNAFKKLTGKTPSEFRRTSNT
jgi:AraC-like DNA-binding protein